MIKKGGRWKAEGGFKSECSLYAHSFSLPPSPLRLGRADRTAQSRFGVTLIELLIAIAIIATLSALFLGASRAAMESSRASRTKTTILKLHTLLMEQWASYETRRVDLDPAVVSQVNAAFGSNPQQLGNAMADIRVLALRELMKFEMPDRWSDIDLSRPSYATKPTGSRDQAAILLESVPTIARAYYRRYDKAYQQAVLNGKESDVYKNQRAECLYMVIMLMTGDGEARTMFAAQDIGDVDDDGLPEFLDGWGRPIEYFRWAPGFISKSSLMSGDTDSDHDPFDPFRRSVVPTVPGNFVQWPQYEDYPGPVANYVQSLRGANIPAGGQVGFRLVPLIFSGGPDGLTDLWVADEDIDTSDPSTGALDPYLADGSGDFFATGGPHTQDGVDESIDNITNHLIDGR
jgi:prepilin-type N-terminal cleavage/methylation domain-containing protein